MRCRADDAVGNRHDGNCFIEYVAHGARLYAQGMTRRRTGLVIAALAGATFLAVSGCTSERPPEPSSTPATGTTVPSSRTVTTTSINLAPSTAGFRGVGREHRGQTDDGTVTWNYTLPQVEGGTKAVREAFNTAMDSATGALVPGPAGTETTFGNATLLPEEASRTVVARTTLSGALIVDRMFTGAAHPTVAVQTVVIEAAAGRALTLDDVLADPAAARVQLATLARAADTTGRLSGSSVDPAELHAWIAVDEGLHLYVPVIHALGDYVPVTLAWTDVAPLLNATGRILFAG